MQNSHTLLKSHQLNATLTLKNKIVMAPMTRNVANDDLSPTNAMTEYYARRADAGLIITEGTIISPGARGYSNVPGIFTEQQINNWRLVTKAVHKNNGLIFLQIWHVGRVSHPTFLNGELPISASATTMTSRINRSEGLYHGASRAASLDEISGIIASYAQAAKNARAAGFDGVEIHGANGYLIDQFLHHHTNHRTDAYGETPENMARFALEVVQACGNAIGFDRVGLRISPGGYLHEIIGDTRDSLVFQYLLQQLNQLAIAYVHTGNFDDNTRFAELDHMTMTQFIRHHYQGTVIASGSYTPDTAEQGVEKGQFDLVAIGRPFIANPDLISRLQTGAIIKPYDAAMLTVLH